MSGSEHQKDPHSPSFQGAFWHWRTCLILLVLVCVFGASFVLTSAISMPVVILVAVVYYIGSGLYLNQAVLQKVVDCYPMMLYGVAADKMKFILLWPVMYWVLRSKLRRENKLS